MQELITDEQPFPLTSVPSTPHTERAHSTIPVNVTTNISPEPSTCFGRNNNILRRVSFFPLYFVKMCVTVYVMIQLTELRAISMEFQMVFMAFNIGLSIMLMIITLLDETILSQQQEWITSWLNSIQSITILSVFLWCVAQHLWHINDFIFYARIK